MTILSGFQLLTSFIFYLALSSWAKTPEGIADLERLRNPWVTQNAGGLFFTLALVSLVLGASALWLARGYVKGYEWSRRRGRMVSASAIVFAILGLLLLPARVDPGSPLWTIVFNIIVITYLGSARVRAYFRSS